MKHIFLTLFLTIFTLNAVAQTKLEIGLNQSRLQVIDHQNVYPDGTVRNTFTRNGGFGPMLGVSRNLNGHTILTVQYALSTFKTKEQGTGSIFTSENHRLSVGLEQCFNVETAIIPYVGVGAGFTYFINENSFVQALDGNNHSYFLKANVGVEWAIGKTFPDSEWLQRFSIKADYQYGIAGNSRLDGNHSIPAVKTMFDNADTFGQASLRLAYTLPQKRSTVRERRSKALQAAQPQYATKDDLGGLYARIDMLLEGQRNLNTKVEVECNSCDEVTTVEPQIKVVEKVEKSTIVYFDRGSSVVNEKGLETLRKFIEDVNLREYSAIQLSGRASKIGNSDANLTLSKDRVENVMSILICNGASTDQISVEFLGDVGARAADVDQNVLVTIFKK